jgi:MFS family permease
MSKDANLIRAEGTAAAKRQAPKRYRGRIPRPSPFGVLIALGVANHLVLTGSRVTVSLNALALGASTATVGGLMALFALLPMLFAIPAGRLADRIGVRAPMLAGSIGMTLGVILATLWPGLPMLFATAMLTGVAFMMFQVAAQYATGEMGGPGARSRNFGLLALGLSTSSIAGPLIAGFVIDHAGFRPTFALLTLLPLVPIAVLASGRVLFPGPHPAHALHGAASALELVTHRELRRVFAINAMIAMAWELHTLFVPIYGHAIGLSASGIGLILAAFAGATFTVRLAMPAIASRVSEHTVLTSALYLAALVYAALPFSRNVGTLMMLSFCLGLGLGAGQPMVMSLLHSHAPPGRMGEAAGVRMSLSNSMAVAVPLLFGAVGGTLGLSPVLWSVGVFLATGGWLTRGARS